MFGMKKKAPAAPADTAASDAGARSGEPIATAASKSSMDSAASGYAGFWLRVLAAFADSAILFTLAFVIAIVAGFVGEMGTLIGSGLILLIDILYWPLMHASQRQATFGKAMLGIIVTHVEGDRISVLRSFGRELAKIVSMLPLGIGFLMAAFTGKKQALHDMIASTVVVRDGDAHIARTLVVAVVGYAVPMIAIPLFGLALFAGLTASIMGDMAGEMKKPPAVSAKPAAPKPAAPAAAKPAATTAAIPAPAGAAAPATGTADKAAPAKAEPDAGPATASVPAPKIELPPDEPEVKAPSRRTASTQRATSERIVPRADMPVQEAPPAPPPKPCVIKPVMTDEEIDACRRR